MWSTRTPSLVDRDRDRTQAVDLEDLQRARIGRRFDHDLVARLGQRLRDQGDALGRAGQHQHVARVDVAAAPAHPFGHRLAQRPVALAVAVGEDEVDVAADARERCREIASGDGSAGGTPCTNAMRSP